jgi:hypothetical protein
MHSRGGRGHEALGCDFVEGKWISRSGLRPARALLGWMEHEEAVLMQAGRRLDDPRNEEYELRARQARLVASTRLPDFNPRGAIKEAPQALRDYKEDERWADLLASGWRIALVDLRRVCAMQPGVFIDVDIPEVDPDDLEALADITMRPPGAVGLDTQYDRDRKAWIIGSASPDYRVSEEFRTDDPDEGVVRLGFEIRLYGSFLQVYRYRDRYLLRDGYHRSLALLTRGINVVPALVGESRSNEMPLLGRGKLAPEVVFGRRPPMLPDYLDDDVSGEVLLPPTRRVIVVQALDLQPYA